MRTCIACRKAAAPGEFVRIARLPEGGVGVEPRGGRGAYVCPNADCIARAFAGDRLARALRTKIGVEQKEGLRQALWDKL